MLEIKEMTMLYESNKGISQFSLSCKKGEIIALIGPNGSGKSTSMKGIVGLLHLQGGSVYIEELNTMLPEAKKSIGYLPENMMIDTEMTGYELAKYVDVVKYEGKDEEVELEMNQMFHDFDLWDARYTKIKKYSMGMKKKLGIILALLRYPPLIVLDEPTNGVDSKGIIMLKRYILKAKQKKSIIIISSHVLDFVEKVCKKYIFIKNGELKEVIDKESCPNLEEIYVKLYMCKQ